MFVHKLLRKDIGFCLGNLKLALLINKFPKRTASFEKIVNKHILTILNDSAKMMCILQNIL